MHLNATALILWRVSPGMKCSELSSRSAAGGIGTENWMPLPLGVGHGWHATSRAAPAQTGKRWNCLWEEAQEN